MRTLSDFYVELKTREEIAAIAYAAGLAAAALGHAASWVAPGVSTERLAEHAYRYAAERGARDVRVFVSVNSAAAHGLPGVALLREGDLVTVDVSLRRDGWYGDSARSYLAGQGSPLSRRLLYVAWRTAWAGIRAIRCGARLSEVARRVRSTAHRNGFRVAEECSGHGIGRALHEPPVMTYADPRVDGYLAPGMVLTVEPVITAGGADVRLCDGVVVTTDGSLAAQFEHTVALLARGPVVLSRPRSVDTVLCRL